MEEKKNNVATANETLTITRSSTCFFLIQKK